MRRWLIALATALVAGGIWVGAAYADGGPHRIVNTQATAAVTTGCASCHRAHTGNGSNLIKVETTYGLCTSCHGPTSSKDVVNGQLLSGKAADGSRTFVAPLKGGGFVNTFMNTSLAATGPTTRVPSTSAHKVNGIVDATGAPAGYTGDTIWGIGAVGSTTAALNGGIGTPFILECSTCHDPHGGSAVDANGARIPTYRILRSDMAAKVTGVTGAPVVVPEDPAGTTHVFQIDTTAGTPGATGVYYGQAYPTATMLKLDDWCGTCHTRIHTGNATDPATSSSGDPIYNFRHPTNGTNVSKNLGTTVTNPSGQGTPGCVTCHVSHGSSAAMGTIAIPKPGQDAAATPAILDSSLLRVDNRGVCELCHNK